MHFECGKSSPTSVKTSAPPCRHPTHGTTCLLKRVSSPVSLLDKPLSKKRPCPFSRPAATHPTSRSAAHPPIRTARDFCHTATQTPRSPLPPNPTNEGSAL